MFVSTLLLLLIIKLRFPREKSLKKTVLLYDTNDKKISCYISIAQIPYYKVSEIRLNVSHIISENGI